MQYAKGIEYFQTEYREYLCVYRQREADVHADEGNPKECDHANQEIELVGLVKVVGLLVLDEAEHGGHDNGGEGDERGVAEQRRQEQESEEHADGHHHVGHGGLAAGVEVDGGFGEGTGGQVAGG